MLLHVLQGAGSSTPLAGPNNQKLYTPCFVLPVGVFYQELRVGIVHKDYSAGSVARSCDLAVLPGFVSQASNDTMTCVQAVCWQCFGLV